MVRNVKHSPLVSALNGKEADRGDKELAASQPGTENSRNKTTAPKPPYHHAVAWPGNKLQCS